MVFATVFCGGNMDMSKRLKEQRLAKDLSQQKLADVLGFGRATYQKWETNVSQPCYDDLIKLAKFFDVSTDCLLGLQDY